MRFSVLALDYDGTIARDGILDKHVKDALGEVRARGIAVVIVTGRILSDLQRVAGELHFADAVVAENGAVLAFPNGHSWLIGRPPEAVFVDELRRRGIAFTTGQCLLETEAALAPQILAVIRELELPFVLVFNRSRVMVLPQGISKATGLRRALAALRLSPHNAIGVGDAENDHDLLAACEIGVAVGWGSPALQRRADQVIRGAGPSDLAAYIRQASNITRLPPDWMGRDKIIMGTTNGAPLGFTEHGSNVLVTGDPQSGKSWATGVFCEQLMLHDYCTCVIDPEGDYEQLEALPRVAVLGRDDPLPSLPDLARVLRHPDVSVVINLSRAPYEEKVKYLMTLLPMLASLRRQTGLPHRIVIDEAHYFLHESNVKELLDLGLGAYTLVTYRASDLNPDVRKAMEIVCVTRSAAPEEAQAIAAMFGASPADLSSILPTLKDGEAAVLLPSPEEGTKKIQRISLLPRLTGHVRHRAKYFEVPIPAGREFVFSADGRPLGPRCRTFKEFIAALGDIPGGVLDGHARRGDFSRWIADVFHDHPLASDLRKLEQRYRLGYVESLSTELARAIRERYEVESELVL